MNIFEMNDTITMLDENFKEHVFCPIENKDYKNFCFYQRNGKVTLRDKDNNLYTLTSMGYFKNGIARIRLVNNKYMLINLDGEVSKQFGYIGDFFNGYAVAKDNTEVKIIDFKFRVSDSKFLLSGLNFENGFLEVEGENGKVFLDKYLSFYARKYQVEKALKEDIFNYEHIPTGYFENPNVIKEFLDICKEKIKQEFKDKDLHDVKIIVKTFAKIVEIKNEQERNNIKKRRLYDEELKNYIGKCIDKVASFKREYSQNYIDESLEEITF